MNTLDRPIVCVVTGGQSALLPTLDAIRAAAEAGATLVQIREHQLDDRGLLSVVRQAIDAVAGTRARVVVNERVDVALAAGASGVHLREGSIAASRVRTLVPGTFLIGRSVHSPASARTAERHGGCDYLVFGTVFFSESKPAGHPVAGLERLREVCGAVTLPVIAIGGMRVACVPEVRAAGAAGIAAISLFREAEAAAQAVREVRRAFDTRS